MSFDDTDRKGALWSTEAAAALGLSDRHTPAQVWSWKRGHTEQTDASENIAARLGLACQEGVARLHVEDTGDVLLPITEGLKREVSGVRMGSHYDYWNKTLKRLHEVKFFALARQRDFGEPGSDTVPYDVLVQALHEMTVWNAESTGYAKAEACEINVVFGNIVRAVYVVPYDLAAVDKLLQREAAFQALVDTNTPPPPMSTADARIVWSKADGTEKRADRVTAQACQALAGLKKQLKTLEAQEEELTLHIQKAMENAGVLRDEGGSVLATWKGVTSERIDVKRLRAELPEVAKTYSNATNTRRFLLK